MQTPAGSTHWLRYGVVALLVLHVALALWAISGKSVTADESLHVTSGYFFNRYGDYRIQPENGNLPQRLAGLPASLLVDVPPALLKSRAWRTINPRTICRQFFYQSGHDHWPLLMAGRCLMVIFSVGTGLLVFHWARRLFGPVAGLFSLTLYALDPNVLAHAPLATSDSAAVFFLLASVTAFWRLLETPGWLRGALSVLTFGLACVAKFSSVLLVPLLFLLGCWWLAGAPCGQRGPQARRIGKWLLVHGAGAIFMIWLFFGFRFSGFSPALPASDQYIVPWNTVATLLGWQGHIVKFLHQWHLLPEAFLYGYSWVILSAQQRAAFLAGEYSVTGWISFFPLAFWWKSTLALLAGLVAAIWFWARRTTSLREVRASFTIAAPLLALFAIYGALSLTSKLNIGHRHILPLYPILYILIGSLAVAGLRPRLRTAGLALLLVVQVAANARIAPHYLAYFNTLAGGPARGWRLLVDSSLDWGQDLPALKKWLAENNQERVPVYLAYFGSGDPAYYHLNATRLPAVQNHGEDFDWYEPAAGLYCVSATILQQVYSPVRGAWTTEFEREYQTARLKEPLFREYWRTPSLRQELHVSGVGTGFENTWQRYDILRFARLCHYLRARQPDAVIGYSIFIHRLSQPEVDATLHGSYSDWLHAIEQAGRDR